MKLIFSMPGVPSADAGAGEQRVDRAAALVDRGVDARLVAEVEVDRLDALEGDRREVHHDDLGAEVLHQLRGRGTHAGGTTDDQRSLAVVAECVCLHVRVLLSPIRSVLATLAGTADRRPRHVLPPVRICNKLSGVFDPRSSR